MIVKINWLLSSTIFVLSSCAKVHGFLNHQTFAIRPLQTISSQGNKVTTSRNSLPSNKHDSDNEVTESSTSSYHSSLASRRSFFQTATNNAELAASSIGLSFIYPQTSAAVEESDKLNLYTDKTCGFQMKIPSSWEKSEQTLPDRRKIVLYIDGSSSGDGNDDKNVIFIAYTPVRDDFTSLSSFGSVDEVGQATILPKGPLAVQETKNKMIVAESKKNSYYFDYTSQSTGQPMRHFRTIFTLVSGATGGAGSVLVTITAQTLESRYDSLKSTFNEVIDSYEKLK